MALKAFLSNPAEDIRHRRHSTVLDQTPTSPTSSHSVSSNHARQSSMKRLSLGLSHSGDSPFSPFLSDEPEDSSSGRASMQAHRQSSSHETADAISEPVMASQSSQIPQQEDSLSNVTEDLLDLPLPKPQRFSILGFRHASDPQLSTRFRSQEPTASNNVNTAPPKIITTAPTSSEMDDTPKPAKRKLFARASSPFRKSNVKKEEMADSPTEEHTVPRSRGNGSALANMILQENTSFERLPRIKPANGVLSPPAYGDESSSSLAIPVTRLSDSSRSDDSAGEHHVYAKTTTTHTISTTTTFFKLKRRKKDKGPLFPLPEKFPASARTSTSQIPQERGFGRKSMSPSRKSGTTIRFDADPSRRDSAEPSPTHSMTALTNAPFGAPGPTVVRQDSAWSNHSGQSTPSVTLIPPRLGARGRSSTMSSLGRSAEKLLDPVPQPTGSARTSTSTSGRRSFGDLLSLPHRLRQNSAPPARYGNGTGTSTPGSKSNSLQIPREQEPERVYPKREDGDTPASYLEKLEAAVPRGSMATILCKSADDFCKTCLRKYMRGFSYFGDSIDMAIRKMLMEVELPKETQQIDRLLAGFADRYYECNPGIFASTDEASYVAFSILLLHSDAHNKNNKRKMQKHDYVKNTQHGQVQISTDILECFFDNICYTPFIHFDDEVAINSHRLAAPRLKKGLIKTRSIESLRGPVDPYTLILDSRLEVLRPPLKEVMDSEDHYSSTGTLGALDTTEVAKAFSHSAVLQIVSARSRPDAFLSQATISNPGDAQAGIVSIKVAKVGLLWRKDPKKKKAKRPWQEWGAILTDSKLYFFKDVTWVKRLIGQHDNHTKTTGKHNPLVFKPPLPSFDPDALMSMDDAVTLVDASYKKHKNAFVFIKHGGFEEVFLANSEQEMNDWMGKLNYAATFRTAGVRMRGSLGTPYDARHLLRKDSDFSTKSGENAPRERKPDPQIAWEIMFYRRQLINEKISDFDEKIAVAQKELDQLLRNARHLLVLLPIQQKTRESLVLGAGRMSAKLKWTRVELWRTRTHRDILSKDLELEGVTAFPVPRTSTTSTPQKTTPLKTGQGQTLGKTITDSSHVTLSPISATSSRPSNLLEKLKTSENEDSRTGLDGTLELPLLGSASTSGEQLLSRRASTQDSHSLAHQASIISSHHSRENSRHARTTDEAEEQVLREAGLIGIDGSVPKDRRPETSESDRDRINTVSTPDVSKGSSVRRLHRSLREGHLPHGVHHHSPSIHRHRKGRESGSSITPTEDSIRSMSEAEELKRGTGSFILHGKKASVITMSSDWQSMTSDERLKLRKAGDDGRPDTIPDEEAAIETASNVSRQSDEFYNSLASNNRQSVATTAGEHFVDAETGVESARSSRLINDSNSR